MTNYVLGLDAGNTMTKAVVFDLRGHEIGAEQRRNPIHFSVPGHTERDADRMWRDAADAIRTVLQKTEIDPSDIAGVATSGYGAGLYLVDERGDPTRMGIMSTDGRGQGVIDQWRHERNVDESERMVQQRFWSGQPAPLMAWLSRHEPEVCKRTHRVLFCKDFLRAKLCGELATDVTDAGLGGLLDVTSGAYSPALFESLGLNSWLDKLPEIRPSTGRAGEITPEAARMTGLRAGTPVYRGIVDVVAAAVASGVTEPTHMSVIAGTFSINSTLHRAPRMDRLPLLQMPYPVNGYYMATEGSPTSASNFEWYCKSVLGAVVAAAAEASGRTIYEMLGSRVQEAMNRPNDIIFMPFLFGGPRGAPAGLIGLNAAHDSIDIVRAIFEGIAFAHRLDIDCLLAGRDVAPVTTLRLTGGAARNEPWAQMFADVLGIPVETTEGTELGALGTSMAAAVGMGAHDGWPAAVRAMVRVAKRFEPRPEWQEKYERKYRRFKSHIECLARLNNEEPQ